VTRPPEDANLVQIQGKISSLIEKIQELMIPRPGKQQVWCTRCYTEGHMVNECPRMRGMEPPQNLMGPSPIPMGGVVQVSMNLPFHTPTPFHAFPGNQVAPSIEYCNIYQIHGHGPRQCHIIHKYSTAPNTVHYEFCPSTTHDTNQCRALDALVDRLDRTSFRVNKTPQGLGRGCGGGARGDFKGGRTGGRRPSRFYNYDEKGHMSRDCPHLRRHWFSYYRTNGHANEDIP
jgi:hypothetical protein